MEKLVKYGGLVFAIVALIVSLVAVGSVRDEAQGLHPGPNYVAAALTVGTDGGGYDITYYSDTAGDLFLWDSSAEELILTGTAAQDALTVADGNVAIVDDLDVDGASSFDAATFGVAGTGNDVQLFSDTSGDHLLWDASEEALEITGTNAQTALLVDDGNVAITYDADIDGTTNLDIVDIDGAVDIDAAVDITGGSIGAASFTGDITLTGSGGNADGATEFIGVPKIALANGTLGTDGSITLDVIDVTPTGECAEVDAGTNLALTADTSIYRATTNSLLMTFAATIENDGFDCTVGATDLQAYESLGFWMYVSEATTTGWFDVGLDEAGVVTNAYDVVGQAADTWVYHEYDINACAAGCDAVDGIVVLVTATGAAGLTATPTVYIDALYVWDADDEEALGYSIVDNGVLSVVAAADAQGSVNSYAPLVEYTSWVTHYETGADFIVYLDDQSANTNLALVAIE